MRSAFPRIVVLLVIAAGLWAGPAKGSVFGLCSVRQALYVNSDADPQIRIYEIPIATALATPEVNYLAIARPYLAPADPGKTPEDANIVSRCGLKIEPEVKQEKVGGNEIEHLMVTVDASAAKVPKDYPFTLEQVIEAAQTCIRLTYGIKPADQGKLTIKVVRPKK